MKYEFTKKYPNGWVVQGNNDKRWLNFHRKTNCVGSWDNYYYYSRWEDINNIMQFYHTDKKPKDETVISVDEFFALYENKSVIPDYEIY